MPTVVGKILDPFVPLRNGVFAKLYFAQTISLLGDAFTWVGLALLAYQFDRLRSPVILATALTLRVTAFIIFSPFAGVVADRIDRKSILSTTHFLRMGVVAGFPFVSAEWQVYVLVFFLNVFSAFFTPTHQAVIPQIVEKKYYRKAVGLTTATYQMLGVLGPALAGVFAILFGAREIFLIDAATFVIAAILILIIPRDDLQPGVTPKARNSKNTLADVGKGIRLMFQDKLVRFALSMEFVAAIAGAMVLVNTISLVKNELHLTDVHYGWTMAMFGIGAAIAAYLAGAYDKTRTRSMSLISGALILGVSICLADFASLSILMVLWALAGLGESLADMPAETLIGENIARAEQGKVYGAHFAFSHLWWAFAYPLAGYLGTSFPTIDFLLGGLVTLFCGLVSLLMFRPAPA